MKENPHPPIPSRRNRKNPTALLPTAEVLRGCFVDFLNLEVASGDAAPDTVTTYLRRISQYLRIG